MQHKQSVTAYALYTLKNCIWYSSSKRNLYDAYGSYLGAGTGSK